MTIIGRMAGVGSAAAAVLILSCARPPAPMLAGAKGGDGVLRVGIVGEPKSLNPNHDRDELALVIGQNLFSKLVVLASDGNVLPDLAQSWDESPDGLTYTFHLRRQVRWHDGRQLTAEDVRATLMRAREESVNRDVATRIASVSAPDPHTAVVQLTAPWAAFIPSLAWYATSILPAHLYGDGTWHGHPANRAPVGSGPFRFKMWEPQNRIVLEKDPAYYGPGPYVDSLEYVVLNSPADAERSLRAGEIDLMIGKPPSDGLRDLERTAGVRVLSMPSEARAYVAFNTRRRPFNDLRVRQAVNMAIHKRELIDRALFGMGTPAVGFYTPAIAWAYNPAARAPAHDPRAARRLLQSAGALSSAPSLLCPGVLRPLADEVARQLAIVGLRVRVAAVSMDEYLRRGIGSQDFDMVLMTGSQGPDPDALMSRFSSSGALQVMGYRNAELDAVLRRASMTSDVAVRAPDYLRAQEILAQDLPIAPLVETVRVSAVRDGIRGLPHDDARGLAADFAFNLVRLPAAN